MSIDHKPSSIGQRANYHLPLGTEGHGVISSLAPCCTVSPEVTASWVIGETGWLPPLGHSPPWIWMKKAKWSIITRDRSDAQPHQQPFHWLSTTINFSFAFHSFFTDMITWYTCTYLLPPFALYVFGPQIKWRMTTAVSKIGFLQPLFNLIATIRAYWQKERMKQRAKNCAL